MLWLCSKAPSLAHLGNASADHSSLCQGPNRVLYSLSHCVQTANTAGDTEELKQWLYNPRNYMVQRQDVVPFTCLSASAGVTHPAVVTFIFIILLEMFICTAQGGATLWPMPVLLDYLVVILNSVIMHDNALYGVFVEVFLITIIRIVLPSSSFTFSSAPYWQRWPLRRNPIYTKMDVCVRVGSEPILLKVAYSLRHIFHMGCRKRILYQTTTTHGPHISFLLHCANIPCITRVKQANS